MLHISETLKEALKIIECDESMHNDSIIIILVFLPENSECKIEDVFFSGARAIPPVGWEGGEVPKLSFIYSPLPTASTCDMILRIPVTHKEY